MISTKEELQKTIGTISELLDKEDKKLIAHILRESDVDTEQTGYDNWNGGTYMYTIFVSVPLDLFAKLGDKHAAIEKEIEDKIALMIRPFENIVLQKVFVQPKTSKKLDWDNVIDIGTKKDLIEDLSFLSSTMISVSTGGQRIQDINEKYQKVYSKASKVLDRLKIQNPNPFGDLWEWYGKWSSGEFPKYADRRTFISSMYKNLLKTIEESETGEGIEVEISGWVRIERSIREIRKRLIEAENEEQFQAIGLICRETIISLAQEIYIREKHPPLDGVEPGETDAKRMLEAYIAVELGGQENENLRKYAKASLALANELTHKRTATRKLARLCSSATINLVSTIRIINE